MTIGVLALQGDFDAHARVLEELGGAVVPIRRAVELDDVAALVIPGGESSTMLRLLAEEDFANRIRNRVAAGMPVLGTCAGMILLATGVEPAQESLGLLDIDVVRNGYGRQVHSTVATVATTVEVGGSPSMEAVFIRAPRVMRVGAGVRVLARWGAEVVAVRQGRVIAAGFHPELTADRRLHSLLLNILEEDHARAVGA